MKKFTLSVLAMLASATCFAQTTLWNGEDKELGSKGDVWVRCDPVVVENDQKGGVNDSEKCLKFTITGTNWDNGDMAFGGLNYDFESKRISLMIKKATNSNVRVNLKFSDGNFHNVAAWYDGAGEWRKLYFDFSTNGISGNLNEVCVYPTTDAVAEGGEVVYVDNIVIEDTPKVDGKLLSDIKDGSLSGNLKLTGAWLKGECQNTDGDWIRVDYNDFNAINEKLGTEVTSIDIREATTKDVDANRFFADKNPNTILYADKAYDHYNVVAEGNAKNIVLTDANRFSIPEGFTAESVTLTRNVRSGINSFVLPFDVKADELGSTKVATYSENQTGDGKTATFDKADNVVANTPFITVDAAATTKLTFTEKPFAATPENLGDTFVGVYAPTDATGFYGIDDKGNLHKGGENASIAAFHAYLKLDEANAPAAISFSDGTTGVNNVVNSVEADAPVYDLSGRRVAASKACANLQSGVYISNGKKFVVK